MTRRKSRISSLREPRIEYGYKEWVGYIKSLDKVGVVFGENKMANSYKVKGEGLIPVSDVRPASEEEQEQLKIAQ